MTFNQEEAITYIDGVEEVRETHVGPLRTNDVEINIGVDDNTWNNWLDGLIDEPVILKVALSESEIKELMKGVAKIMAGVTSSGKLTASWARIKSVY